MECGICDFNKETQHIIFETKYWIINISDNQGYLGRSVICLKRHAGDLNELKPAEWEDLIELIKNMEAAIRKAFGSTLFNWTCLMNNAYKRSPPNPHVHWHVLPRYNHKVEFAGMTFEDVEFAHMYNSNRELKVPDSIEQKIIKKIRESLGV